MRPLAVFGIFGVVGFLALAAPLSAGPSLVADLHPGPTTELQQVQLPGAGGEVAYFAAADPAHGLELWRTDGTPGGTWRLTDICPGQCSSDPKSMAVFSQGRIFFSADDGVSGRELWQSDGTPGIERRVRDLCPGPCHGDPTALAVLDDRLLFVASTGRQRSLWSSDGSRRGTAPVKEICTSPTPDSPPGSNCPWFPGLQKAGKLAYFGLPLPAGGFDLWRSDGTAAGTRSLRRLFGNGVAVAEDSFVTPLGDAGLLCTHDGLWRTDGTAAGTVLVDDLTVAGAPSWPRELTVVGERLFFSAYNESTSAELWTSLGEAPSTGLVADLHRGLRGSHPQALTAVDGVLVFAATDGEHGLEPWRSDGTAAGTRRVADINPGRDASSPGPFSLVDDVLLTGADDGEHGRELWAIPVSDVIVP